MNPSLDIGQVGFSGRKPVKTGFLALLQATFLDFSTV